MTQFIQHGQPGLVVFFVFGFFKCLQQLCPATLDVLRTRHDIDQLVLQLLRALGVLHGLIQRAGPAEVAFRLFKVFPFQMNIAQRFALLSNTGTVLQLLHDLQGTLELNPGIIVVFLQEPHVAEVGIAAGFAQGIAQLGHEFHGPLIMVQSFVEIPFPGSLGLEFLASFVKIDISQTAQKVGLTPPILPLLDNFQGTVTVLFGFIELFGLTGITQLEQDTRQVAHADTGRLFVAQLLEQRDGFLDHPGRFFHLAGTVIQFLQILIFG